MRDFSALPASPSVPTEAPQPAVLVRETTGFLVWTKSGKNPSRYHPTREIAEREASRLAAKHPGRAFFVVAMVNKYKAFSAAPELAKAA